jgi:hypothetical protein
MMTLSLRRHAPILGLLLLAAPLLAQDPLPAPPSPVAGPRAQASREELQARLVEVDRILSSSGYSSRLKDVRRREAELIKRRLAEGDIGVGDQINLTVLNEPTLTGTFLVGPGRTLTLPGVGDIPMAQVLRSEVEDHLTRELAKYVRNPSVRATAMIRLTIFGDVGKPGYFQMPADWLVGDAMMAAGGPSSGQRLDINIKRMDRQILTKDDMKEAIRLGMTLDQLNLQAGDEIEINGRRTTFNYGTVIASIGALLGVVYLFERIF